MARKFLLLQIIKVLYYLCPVFCWIDYFSKKRLKIHQRNQMQLTQRTLRMEIIIESLVLPRSAYCWSHDLSRGGENESTAVCGAFVSTSHSTSPLLSASLLFMPFLKHKTKTPCYELHITVFYTFTYLHSFLWSGS